MKAARYKSPEAVVKAVTEIPSPYVKPPELDEYLLNMNTQIDKINDLLRVDYAVVIRIFKLANSVVMGGNEEKVLKINDAISSVGNLEISRIVQVSQRNPALDIIPPQLFNLESFWNHSLATAIAAEEIAKFIQEENPECFFICGLLHDIGRLLMLLAMPKQYAICMLEGRQKNRSLQSQELRVFGFDHAEVGVEAIKEWKFPSFAEEAIEYHHTASDARKHPRLVTVTHLADALAHALHIGQSGEVMMPKIYSQNIQEIGINPYQLHDLSGRVIQKIGAKLIKRNNVSVAA